MTAEQYAARRKRQENMERLERDRERYPIDIKRNLAAIKAARRQLRPKGGR